MEYDYAKFEKKWKLLELQITQTRHNLSILNRNMSKFKTQKLESIHDMCTK